MLQVERHYHPGNPEILALCGASQEIYNSSNFLIRKAFFEKQPLPKLNQLYKHATSLPAFSKLHNSKTVKQTLRKLLTDWSNFKKSLAAFRRGPQSYLIHGLREPKPPYYKEKLAQVIFYKETIKKGPL